MRDVFCMLHVSDTFRLLKPSTSLLPLQDKFRTIDWKKIKEKISDLTFISLKEVVVI